MKTFAESWKRWIYILGLVLFFLGALDPLEGSVSIAAGSMLISLIVYIERKQFWRSYLIASLMIFFGVAFMFYFSSLGGWDSKSNLSNSLVVFILPYPIGWVMTIVYLIKSLRLNKKQNAFTP
jgi:hypothetical protein